MTNDFGYNVRSEVIGALMGTNTYNYAYDPIGNRLTATNNAEGWAYLANPLNQYTNILRASAPPREDAPTYDLDGNMTATGDGWRYVWNAENRLILASNATTVVSYAYDHRGRMMAKTVDDVARQYLWDGYNIVRETIQNPQSTITNQYIWGLDLSGSLHGAGGIGGLLAEIQDSVPYFAAFDANGNVTEYISTNGVTDAHYEYSPFGEIVVQSGDLADTFTHRFSTKPWCGVTGLSEYLFRKYGPGMGRWRSRDPIKEAGGNNLYAIANNQLLSGSDVLGLFSRILCCETEDKTKLLHVEALAKEMILNWITFLNNNISHTQLQSMLYGAFQSHIPSDRWENVDSYRIQLRQNLRYLMTSLLGNRFGAQCETSKHKGCKKGGRAFTINPRSSTLSRSDYDIHFCPQYFSTEIEDRKRAAIIVHELSHMVLEPRTKDDYEWVDKYPLTENLKIAQHYEFHVPAHNVETQFLLALEPACVSGPSNE